MAKNRLTPQEQIRLLREALDRTGVCRCRNNEPLCARCEALIDTHERKGWTYVYKLKVGDEILMPDETTWVTVEIVDRIGERVFIGHREGGFSQLDPGTLIRWRPARRYICPREGCDLGRCELNATAGAGCMAEDCPEAVLEPRSNG